MTDLSPTERVQSLRVLMTMLLITAAILGGLVFWLLGGIDAPLQPVLVGVFVGATVVASVVMDRHWLRLPAIELDEPDPNNKAHEIFLAHSIQKFAVIEAPLILAIGLGFVVESGWPVITTALAVIAALAVVVWPSPRNVTRAATKLESHGVRTGLVEDFAR